MDRATSEVLEQRRQTPKTEGAKFVVTELDVGTVAVRHGHMADLEERHQVLLAAAKLVLTRVGEGKAVIGAAHEWALRCAIAMSERS